MSELIENYARQTAKQRYQNLLDSARRHNTLWTLSDEQGCLVVDTGKEKVLLIFSEAELASHWASTAHAGFTPLAITLEAFIEKWLPGMANDNYDLAIAPSMAGEGTIVDPMQFADELRDGKPR